MNDHRACHLPFVFRRCSLDCAKLFEVDVGEPGDLFHWAFIDLAMVASYEGDTDRAIALGRAGANLAADFGDRTCAAILPCFLTVGGRADEAMKVADRTLSAVEATGVPSSVSVAHWAKGKAFAATHQAIALAAYERASVVARQSGNRIWEAMAVVELAALRASSVRGGASAGRAGQTRLTDRAVSRFLGHRSAKER
jgi:hypothetical protein